MVRGEERRRQWRCSWAVIHRDRSYVSFTPQTNSAFGTTVPTPLSSNYSDLPDLPPPTLIPYAVVYVLAPLCLSVLWDRFVQLMQSSLQLGSNLHPMFANSS